MEKHSIFRRAVTLLLLVALGLLPGVYSVALADSPSKTEDGALGLLERGVKDITLSNGLKVLLYRRGEAPVFAGVIGVRVGGVDEEEGETGIAHMLEHMAFKGTTRVGTKDWAREEPLLEEMEQIALTSRSGNEMNASQRARWREINAELAAIWDIEQFSREYVVRGGVGLNAATSSDWTKYFVSLPSSEFEYWCWLESERLVQPVMRQFYKERDVVMEERRMRVEDSPAGQMYVDFLHSAFSTHRYRRPVIGYADDIRMLTATKLKAFHRKHYIASNIVVGAVGDIDAEAALPILEKYFGRVPTGTPVTYSAQEPIQKGERRFVTRYPSQPLYAIGYPKPNFPHEDDPPLSILDDLLAGGRTSLLHQELVLKKGIAADVSVEEVPGYRYPNMILFSGTPKSPHSVREIVDAFDRVVARVKSELVPSDRIAASVNRQKVAHLGRMASNYSLADDLVGSQLTMGDWRLVMEWYRQIEKVAPEDIRRVARRYLAEDRRTLGELRNAAEAVEER